MAKVEDTVQEVLTLLKPRKLRAVQGMMFVTSRNFLNPSSSASRIQLLFCGGFLSLQQICVY